MNYCSTAHTTQRALICSSTFLGIKGSPLAIEEEKQSMASLWSLLLKQKSQAVWEMGRDQRRGGTNRQGDTIEKVTQTRTRTSQVVKDSCYGFFRSLTPKSTKYQKITFTTKRTWCLHTISLLSERTPNQAGHSLKKHQAWGTWYALFKMRNK